MYCSGWGPFPKFESSDHSPVFHPETAAQVPILLVINLHLCKDPLAVGATRQGHIEERLTSELRPLHLEASGTGDMQTWVCGVWV